MIRLPGTRSVKDRVVLQRIPLPTNVRHGVGQLKVEHIRCMERDTRVGRFISANQHLLLTMLNCDSRQVANGRGIKPRCTSRRLNLWYNTGAFSASGFDTNIFL